MIEMTCLLRFGGMTFWRQFAPFSHPPPCMTLLAHDSLGDALCSVRVLVISSQVLFILHPIADPRSNLFIPLQDSRWHVLNRDDSSVPICTFFIPAWLFCLSREPPYVAPEFLNHAPHLINFFLYLLTFLYTFRVYLYLFILISPCLYIVMSV